MNAALPQCTNCQARVPEDLVNLGRPASCPSCAALLQIEIFPALFRRTTVGQPGEAVMLEGEASCFYHPQKKAVLPCDACGRFLCALCDCELNGHHWCPACLELGSSKGRIQGLIQERTLYDSIALALAVYPVVLVITIYLTVITAPMALYMAVRFWNAPRSLVHRTKLRYVFALVFSSLQIVGWAVLIYFFATGFKTQ